MVEGTRSTSAGSVSAEEHERVERDLAALVDQFEAANEVLSAMGRSAGDPDTVLTTVVESARRLCRSQAAHLYLLEDGVFRVIKAVGLTAVGDSRAEADRRYRDAERILLAEARLSLEEPPLPG